MNKLSLESFYGGKQGVSPIVKARFKYINTEDPAYQNKVSQIGEDRKSELKPETMELCFADPIYKDVWYGQLAIIDTTNKRNPNNGKLFRRVLARDGKDMSPGDTPHGVYIGQIVGPSGGFPMVKLGSIDNMIQEIKTQYQSNSIDDIRYPTGNETIGNSIDKSDQIAIKNSSGPGVIAELNANKNNHQLIPGAKKNNNGTWDYETGIHYSWVNVRNIAENPEDTYVYLGFTIPYTFFDFDIQNVSWEEKFETKFLNKDAYEKGTQPFYQHRQIKIPSGITGNSIGSIRRAKYGDFRTRDMNPESTKDILYKFEEIEFDKNQTPSFPEMSSFSEEGLKTDTSILVYTFYINYKDENDNPKTKLITCYGGKIKDIENIELKENGSFEITYTDGEEAQTLNIIKWIKNVVYDNKNHKFIITYNTGDSYSSDSLHEIEYIQLIENNDHTAYIGMVKYVDENEPQQIPYFQLQYVDGLNIDKDSGEVKYHMYPSGGAINTDYKTYKSFDGGGFFLNGVDAIYLGKDGHLYVKYSSSESRPSPETYTTDSYYRPNRDEYIDKENKKWYRGGDFPDAKIPAGMEEKDARESWAWWLDLGNVQTKTGVRIAGEFNKKRFNEYLRLTNDKRYPFDFDNATYEEICEILNAKWIINEKNYNPYQQGHIHTYNLGDNTNLDATPIADNMGQLIYLNGNAYYYDFSGQDSSPWKYAGPCAASDDKIQIGIQDNNSFIPSDMTPHPQGLTFLNTPDPNNTKNPFPNIWEI